MNNEQTQQADDPSDDRYWRNVLPSEILQPDDMMRTMAGLWLRTTVPGKFARDGCGRTYRRRIEPQQPSDSEPETIDSWEMRLAKMTQWNLELESLVAEAERSGEQVNAELQQLREQVATLTRERDRYRNQLEGAIEHSKAPEAQAQLVDRLQKWLRPVLEVVSDHPDHSSILAASVLEFLPQIASRLIEE